MYSKYCFSYRECGQHNYVCEKGENEALWAMAKDAPGWHLPKGNAKDLLALHFCNLN